MKHILYGVIYGTIAVAAYIFPMNIMTDPEYRDPKQDLMLAGILFLFGFVVGLFAYEGVLKKKAEEEKKRKLEEKRKLEQDETNRMMREYIKKRMEEDNRAAE
jgi:hypothetical protein